MYPIPVGFSGKKVLSSPFFWLVCVFIILQIPTQISQYSLDEQIPIGKEKFRTWWIENGQQEYASAGKGVNEKDYESYELDYVNKNLKTRFVYQLSLVPHKDLYNSYSFFTALFLHPSILALIISVFYFGYFALFMQNRWPIGLLVLFVALMGIIGNLIYYFWFSSISTTFVLDPINGTTGIEAALFVCFLMFHRKKRVHLRLLSFKEKGWIDKFIDYRYFAGSWFVLSVISNLLVNPNNYHQITILNLFVMMIAFPVAKLLDDKFYVPEVIPEPVKEEPQDSIGIARLKISKVFTSLENFQTELAWSYLKDGVRMMNRLPEDYKGEINDFFIKLQSLNIKIQADSEEFYELGQELAIKDCYHGSLFCLERAVQGSLPEIISRHALFMILELRITHKIDPAKAKVAMMRILKANNEDPLAAKVKRLIKENINQDEHDLNDELDKILNDNS